MNCRDCGHRIKDVDDAAIHVLTCPMTRKMKMVDDRRND
jgi:hypothetical protein